MTHNNPISLAILLIVLVLCAILVTGSLYIGFQLGVTYDGIDEPMAKVLEAIKPPIDEPELPISEEEPELEIKLETIEEIKAYIRLKAQELGVDPELALRIAKAESDFRNICNQKIGCLGGIGIFQIVQSTFDETKQKIRFFARATTTTWLDYWANTASPHNIQDNIGVALWLMSQGEYWRWENSAHKWDIEGILK